MSIYRGTGGATSVSGDATVEEVLGYSTDAQAAAASASVSEGNASSSASAASTSASNASTSESNAATSESNASTSETNAATSASNASTSEINAAASAVSAAAQVTLAAAEVTNAQTEVTYAEEWANKAEDSLVSVAAGGDGTTEYSAKHWAAKAADIVAEGVIDDTQTSALLTWSSSKISDSVSGTTLTKTFTTSEEYALTLDVARENPFVTVQKEVPQTGLSADQFSTAANYQSFEFVDYASAVALTLDDTTGTVTATRASGTWDAADVGRNLRDTVNGGEGVIEAVDGTAATVLVSVDFGSTSIASGDWELNEIVIADGTMTVGGYTVIVGGLETADSTRASVPTIVGASYDSVSFSPVAQESTPRDVTFNFDGTQMFVLGQTTNQVHSYTLSTPFDLSSTITFVASFDFSAQTTGEQSFVFSPDGTRMFILDFSNGVHQYNLSVGFDVTTAVFDSVFSVATQESAPRGLDFSIDGTKMYVIGTTGNDVNTYNLSVAWDVSTAVFSNQFSVSTNAADPWAVRFNTDGTRMFVLGRSNDDINEYALTTGFAANTATFVNSINVNAQATNPASIEISTDGTKLYMIGDSGVFQYSLPQVEVLATYEGVSFDVSGQDILPASLTFNTDGTKLYMLGHDSDNVHQYTLSTAFDVNTASYDSVSFSVSAQESIPREIVFKPDGTKMYMAGQANDSVYQYSLSTAWDLSTASYDSVSFSVAAQNPDPYTMALNTDGTKMYVGGALSDTLYQYTLSTAFDVSTASYDSVSFSVLSEGTSLGDVKFNSDGTRMWTLDYGNNSVYQYTLSTAFNVSTASYDSVSFDVSAQDGSPFGLAFNTDGTKMYIVGSTNDTIYQYKFNAISYNVKEFSVAAQDTSPYGIAFNTDGTKMYITGSTNDTVYQYSLSTSFDINTASYDSVSFSVAAQDTSPLGINFNTDGTKMYIVGNVNDSIFQYTLSTGFDLSTASYDSVSFSVTTEDTNPYDVLFNTDGTKMYIMGGTNDTVYQYTLSTGFDLSTASYDSVSFSVTTEDTSPTDIAFTADGTKMYIMGLNNDAVYQYSLSTGFDLSTASYDSVSFSVAEQTLNPTGITLNTDGTKMFILAFGVDKVFEYSIATSATAYKTGEYIAAVTSSTTDTSFWTDINSLTSTDAANSETLTYAYSVDGRTTWIVSSASGDRGIVRNNAGTWEYNSNATYASTTWTAGATNTELATLEEAMSVTANQMTSTAMNALADAEIFTVDDTLDLAVILRTDTASRTPTFDNIAYGYTAVSKYQGAVLGTDYDYYQQNSNADIKITSLGEYNFKVKVL